MSRMDVISVDAVAEMDTLPYLTVALRRAIKGWVLNPWSGDRVFVDTANHEFVFLGLN